MLSQRVHDCRPHEAAVECRVLGRQRRYIVDLFFLYALPEITLDLARSSCPQRA